ncbi:hypothetical protein CQW23_15931 [Capsicum baccatum]|uniref:Yippee domain-containing protein n=1 Tax=Capsicum baccatum TaxID=33114 RepID=A0A2G2WNF8_CAPBA|nr:hypothetical protein CQW23_15931 [Capsicum baccatum]
MSGRALYQCNEIKCRSCGTRVAFRQDYLRIVLNLIPRGIFDRVVTRTLNLPVEGGGAQPPEQALLVSLFNVEVSEDVNDYRVINGYTLVDVFCFQCETLPGWQFITVPQPSPSIYIRQGRFYMRLHKLTYWDNEPLLRDLNEELGLPYELVPDEQVLGGNEQNADQDGNANEQIPTEQDLGANEPNADQDGEFNEQVPNEQDVDVNEQNADLDGDNEQNHDQDEGGNDQNNDEDGSPQAKRRKM